MRKLILASHGECATGMKHSLDMIAGSMATDIEVCTLYPGQSPDDMAQALREEINQNGADFYIIATDLKGGSVHTALTSLLTFSNVVMFCGMNMSLLLSLVLLQETPFTHETGIRLLKEARESMEFLEEIQEMEMDDF